MRSVAWIKIIYQCEFSDVGSSIVNMQEISFFVGHTKYLEVLEHSVKKFLSNDSVKKCC